MTSFDERKRAAEAKFAHDEEFRFKTEARRNRLLGEWAAELLGHKGDAATAYMREVISADFEAPGDEDVYQKLATDLAGKADEATIRAKMAEFLETAGAQLLAEE